MELQRNLGLSYNSEIPLDKKDATHVLHSRKNIRIVDLTNKINSCSTMCMGKMQVQEKEIAKIDFQVTSSVEKKPKLVGLLNTICHSDAENL